MSLLRVRATVNGFTGGPGLMTQYFSTAVAGNDAVAAGLASQRVVDALTAGAELWPNGVSWSVDATVDLLDEATGQLLDAFSTAGGTVNGSSAFGGIGPSPAGACVTWRTPEVKNGHRVMGRTFLVPLHSGAFQTDGTLMASTVTSAMEFADAMGDAGATDLVHVVWSRPVNGSGGTKHGITSATVRDKTAVLRSRRD